MENERETRIEKLRVQIEGGDYQPPAEALVESIERTEGLVNRPIGSLTADERFVVVRSRRFQNEQARQRLEEQKPERPPEGRDAITDGLGITIRDARPWTVCPIHRTRFLLKTGDRNRDCSFCRNRRENAAECEEQLAAILTHQQIQEAERRIAYAAGQMRHPMHRDDFREEGGMAHDRRAGISTAFERHTEALDPLLSGGWWLPTPLSRALPFMVLGLFAFVIGAILTAIVGVITA